METVAKEDRSMAAPCARATVTLATSARVMGKLVHQVRLGDVQAKLAMRWGEKRQNQVSIIIHDEVVIHYQKSWYQLLFTRESFSKSRVQEVR